MNTSASTDIVILSVWCEEGLYKQEKTERTEAREGATYKRAFLIWRNADDRIFARTGIIQQ